MSGEARGSGSKEGRRSRGDLVGDGPFLNLGVFRILQSGPRVLQIQFFIYKDWYFYRTVLVSWSNPTKQGHGFSLEPLLVLRLSSPSPSTLLLLPEQPPATSQAASKAPLRSDKHLSRERGSTASQPLGQQLPFTAVFFDLRCVDRIPQPTMRRLMQNIFSCIWNLFCSFQKVSKE